MKNLYYCLIFFLAFFSILTLPLEAAGDEDKLSASVTWGLEMYSGWQADTEGQGCGYIGAGLDRNVSDHWALTAKVFSSYLYYKYESEPGIVKAKAPGLKLQVGTKYFDRGTYLIITGGLDYRDTSLRPDDKGSNVRGSRGGVTFEALYSRDLSERVVVELIGSYSTIGDTLWGRGRLKHLVSSLSGGKTNQKVFVGIEGVGQGNSDYSASQIGAFAEIQRIKEQFSVLLSAGYKHSNSISSLGYIAIEFYRRF